MIKTAARRTSHRRLESFRHQALLVHAQELPHLPHAPRSVYGTPPSALAVTYARGVRQAQRTTVSTVPSGWVTVLVVVVTFWPPRHVTLVLVDTDLPPRRPVDDEEEKDDEEKCCMPPPRPKPADMSMCASNMSSNMEPKLEPAPARRGASDMDERGAAAAVRRIRLPPKKSSSNMLPMRAPWLLVTPSSKKLSNGSRPPKNDSNKELASRKVKSGLLKCVWRVRVLRRDDARAGSKKCRRETSHKSKTTPGITHMNAMRARRNDQSHPPCPRPQSLQIAGWIGCHTLAVWTCR